MYVDFFFGLGRFQPTTAFLLFSNHIRGCQIMLRLLGRRDVGGLEHATKCPRRLKMGCSFTEDEPLDGPTSMLHNEHIMVLTSSTYPQSPPVIPTVAYAELIQGNIIVPSQTTSRRTRLGHAL